MMLFRAASTAGRNNKTNMQQPNARECFASNSGYIFTLKLSDFSCQRGVTDEGPVADQSKLLFSLGGASEDGQKRGTQTQEDCIAGPCLESLEIGLLIGDEDFQESHRGGKRHKEVLPGKSGLYLGACFFTSCANGDNRSHFGAVYISGLRSSLFLFQTCFRDHKYDIILAVVILWKFHRRYLHSTKI